MRHTILFAALLSMFLIPPAYADKNSPARVRAFAALPDWNGMWQSSVWPMDVSGRVPGGDAKFKSTLQLLGHPPYNDEWEERFQTGMKDTVALAAKNATFKACTRGFPSIMEGPSVFQIVILPEETLLVFESQQVRHIYTDGRQHPAKEELWPTFLGDSIGHWQGDTLIVDTIARTLEPLAPRAWLSVLSDQAHFTERLRVVSRTELEDQLTIEDPIALARPWRLDFKYTRLATISRMLPYDCTENERNPVVDGKIIIATP
jgi:hypothetical protein